MRPSESENLFFYRSLKIKKGHIPSSGVPRKKFREGLENHKGPPLCEFSAVLFFKAFFYYKNALKTTKIAPQANLFYKNGLFIVKIAQIFENFG